MREEFPYTSGPSPGYGHAPLVVTAVRQLRDALEVALARLSLRCTAVRGCSVSSILLRLFAGETGMCWSMDAAVLCADVQLQCGGVSCGVPFHHVLSQAHGLYLKEGAAQREASKGKYLWPGRCMDGVLARGALMWAMQPEVPILSPQIQSHSNVARRHQHSAMSLR